MTALCVRELFIYPLKSGAGMRVPQAAVDELGFVGDRRWMAVDANRRFLSQRTLPRMALIQATALSDDLFLSAPDVPSLRVVCPPPTAAEIEVVVWNDSVTARDGGNEAAQWLSTVLQHDARLVHCPPSRARAVDSAYAHHGERVGFADGFPLLVLGYGSLREINLRLRSRQQDAVGIERFRPNIVIEGAAPFAEDEWTRIRIGTGAGAIEIDLVKPCARCSTISVDPRTGVQGVEPMRTLATYRRRDHQVYVAQNALHRAPGTISTGDEVSVL